MSRSDFDTDAKYREQLFKELIEIVHELGWSLTFPSGGDREEPPYMVIGPQKNIDKVLEKLNGKANRTKT